MHSRCAATGESIDVMMTKILHFWLIGVQEASESLDIGPPVESSASYYISPVNCSLYHLENWACCDRGIFGYLGWSYKLKEMEGT